MVDPSPQGGAGESISRQPSGGEEEAKEVDSEEEEMEEEEEEEEVKNLTGFFRFFTSSVSLKLLHSLGCSRFLWNLARKQIQREVIFSSTKIMNHGWQILKEMV